MDIEKVKKGTKLYVKSSYYIDHDEDDVEGGIAEVESVKWDTTLPKEHFNAVFVTFKNLPMSYNLKYILENQSEWAIEYAGKTAHMCVLEQGWRKV